MKLRTILCCLHLVWMGCLAGCSTTSLFTWNMDGYVHSGPKNPVTEVVSVWQPGEGTDGDGKMARGFVGQLYFFTGKNPAPVVVDGAVRVYLFDDQGAPEEQVKPIHQFDFTPEAWNTHMGKGKLGPTYSAFIPYTRKGFHEARCALRVKFTPRQGTPYFSEMVHIALPGSKSKAIAQKKMEEQFPVVQASAKFSPASQSADSGQHKPRRPVESIQDLVAGLNREKSEARRSAATPLSAAERERIIREAKEKMMPSQVRPASTAKPVEATEEIRVPGTSRRQSVPATVEKVDDLEQLPDSDEESRDSAANSRKSLKSLTIRIPEPEVDG
jgi:hypothetical protein